MALSPKEQYLYHCRKWMSEYHLSFVEIEDTPLEILLDLEVVDSKVEAAFAARQEKHGKHKPFYGKKLFLDQIH